VFAADAVDHAAAGSADEVVVIVPDAVLVAGRWSCGLDAPQQARSASEMSVVHRVAA
jgi:hypothetical protein